MPGTYTPELLKGSGSVAASFGTGGGGVRVFSFSNPGGPAYFFLESITGKDSNGFIPIDTTDYIAGTFTAVGTSRFPEITKNNYKFGAVIPPGGSAFKFTPTDQTRGGQIRFRGTGNFTLSWL